jgi:hypothetical protein
MSQSAVSMPTLGEVLPGQFVSLGQVPMRTAGTMTSHNSDQHGFRRIGSSRKIPAIGDDSPQPLKPSLSTRTTMRILFGDLNPN